MHIKFGCNIIERNKQPQTKMQTSINVIFETKLNYSSYAYLVLCISEQKHFSRMSFFFYKVNNSGWNENKNAYRINTSRGASEAFGCTYIQYIFVQVQNGQ